MEELEKYSERLDKKLKEHVKHREEICLEVLGNKNGL